ncbi:MAG: hypothetical protein MJA30_17810 [Cytophagales bacterium]|nr:hypothetical protein [Cytophagales bacterium]
MEHRAAGVQPEGKEGAEDVEGAVDTDWVQEVDEMKPLSSGGTIVIDDEMDDVMEAAVCRPSATRLDVACFGAEGRSSAPLRGTYHALSRRLVLQT